MGKGSPLLAKRRSVLVQVCVHGINFGRVRKGKRYLQEMDGVGAWRKGLDGVH